MTAVVLAELTDVEAALARLLDRPEQLLVDRKTAATMLDLSDTMFGNLLRDGVIRPVPHARPPKYSVALLRRFARGDGDAFQTEPPADAEGDGPDGSIGTGAVAPAPVSPLPRPRAGGQGSVSDGTGGTHPPAA